jgi:hypothetical protein
MLDKARIIATSKRVRRSEANRNIWCVESETVRGKFYKVEYIEGELMCDCRATSRRQVSIRARIRKLYSPDLQ